MKTRDFDPVLSAALRNELEALADGRGAERGATRHRTPGVRRPQVWITVATAIVLIIATFGALRLSAHDVPPADPGSRVVDPLTSATTPSSPYYVARSVRVVLHARGTGSGTHAFTVPAGVQDVTLRVNCAPDRTFSTRIDGLGDSSGGCSRDGGSSFSGPISAGAHRLTLQVGAGTAYRLLLIATPGPTVSPGALIDPLQQVRDLRNPDAVVGDTRPLLRASQATGSAVSAPLPAGVRRVRVLLVCTPASASTTAVVSGRLVSGCQNSVAHWLDLTPPTRTLTASVRAPLGTTWSLLVIPAPQEAKDSPANTALPYPAMQGTVLAQARGAGAEATGTYEQTTDSIGISTTCRGTGWLEITTGSSGTTTRGTACSTTRPSRVGFGGPDDVGRHRFAVIPHGDISWTFQITRD